MICRITYLPQDVVSNNLFFLKQKKKTGKLRYFSSILRSMEIQKGTRCFHLAQPASTVVRLRVRPGEVYGSFRGGGPGNLTQFPAQSPNGQKIKKWCPAPPPPKKTTTTAITTT